MSRELLRAINMLEKEKNVNKEMLFAALEEALVGAYKKNFDSHENVRVKMDQENGDIKVFAIKDVVEELNDKDSEILIEDAKKISAKYQIGDKVEIEITPRKFGRIAAQAAKQQVVQKIREAEKEAVYLEYEQKCDELIYGIIQRKDRNNIIVDIGKVEGILPFSEQSSNENYRPNDKMKFYIMEVKKTNKAPKIILSRTHPGLVKRLFEIEVPEINSGIVEVKNISREPGSRTKIAVYSYDENVDPVGACVGQKGSRVQKIVEELKGEKIDIITWSSDPAEFISSSLSPANVIKVDINEAEKSARIIVPDFQLSLAIGKEGQNARLAAKLTSWKIDIKSETQRREELEGELLFDKGDKLFNNEQSIPKIDGEDLFGYVGDDDIMEDETSDDEE